MVLFCVQAWRKKKAPRSFRSGGPLGWVPGSALLSHGGPHYHRRWAVSLPRSGWDRVVPARHGRQAIRFGRPRLGGAAGVRSGSVLANVGVSRRRLRRRARRRPLGRCMAKPRGQLVPVSFARCRASTPGLSTSWSARALRGTRGPGEVSSWEGLPA